MQISSVVVCLLKGSPFSSVLFYFFTEYYNSRQNIIMLFWKYVLDIRHWLNLFWEHMDNCLRYCRVLTTWTAGFLSLFYSHTLFSVYLQPDGVWKRERQPAHRGLHHPGRQQIQAFLALKILWIFHFDIAKRYNWRGVSKPPLRPQHRLHFVQIENLSDEKEEYFLTNLIKFYRQ